MASNIPADYFQISSKIVLEDRSDLQTIKYEPPEFNPNDNYYQKFWLNYLENEKVLSQIQEVSSDNLKVLNQIYNLEDFYDNNLLPKMFAFPNQYIARLQSTNDRKAPPAKKPEAGPPMKENRPTATSKLVKKKSASGGEEPTLANTPAKNGKPASKVSSQQSHIEQ